MHDVKPKGHTGCADRPPVFLTGATGYVGGRLAPRLLEADHPIRCYVRSPGKLSGRSWAKDPRAEIMAGDLDDRDRLADAMRGCACAYYLVHSMISAGSQYASRDHCMAEQFAQAAADSAIKRIIYLGGLGELGDGLSEHLASRREVETALASTSVPVTVLRAAMIIGSGSASFEILRYLVERLPIMITPRWVSTESQPISIRNVIGYLVDCLGTPETIGRILDIGGPDVVTYRQLMQIMAEARGLRKRVVIPVPVLTPRLSSLWIHLITPLSSQIARPLAEGLRNRVVCGNDEAQRLMPQELLTVRQSIDAALEKIERSEIETIWSAAGALPGDPDWAGGTVFTDERSMPVKASAEAIFRVVCRVGGTHGWYAAGWLWRMRGMIDRLLGGPGLRRGRRDPEHVAFGEALDFWRVAGIEPNRHLKLRAEMKLPGEALLEFRIDSDPGHAENATLVQTARFRPRGLLGILYWYSLLPLHHFVFGGMLRGIRSAAEVRAGDGPKAQSPGGNHSS